MVSLRYCAVGAVFLPPGALHQKILSANLTLPWVMPVVQSLKEVSQYKAVIAFKGHPPGSHQNPAVPPLWEGDIFRVQREDSFPEYLRRKGQQVLFIEAFCLVQTGNKLPELCEGPVHILRDGIVKAEGLQDCCAQCFALSEKGLIIFRWKDS